MFSGPRSERLITPELYSRRNNVPGVTIPVINWKKLASPVGRRVVPNRETRALASPPATPDFAELAASRVRLGRPCSAQPRPAFGAGSGRPAKGVGGSLPRGCSGSERGAIRRRFGWAGLPNPKGAVFQNVHVGLHALPAVSSPQR